MCLLGFLLIGYTILLRSKPIYTNVGHEGQMFKKVLLAHTPEKEEGEGEEGEEEGQKAASETSPSPSSAPEQVEQQTSSSIVPMASAEPYSPVPTTIEDE